MPDLRSMSGKPLPVADLAPGTVTVRVARQMPANAVAGVEVTATVAAPGGKTETRAVKTGADGRATFEGLPVGAAFQASVVVDGEKLDTARFPVPSQGGTRTMLIAGIGAGAGGGGAAAAPQEPPAAEQAATPERFRLGATTGTVEPAPGAPVGTLEIAARDKSGKPLAGIEVRLGQVKGEQIEIKTATADAGGVARFSALQTGEQAAYAAVIEHEGVRLSTEPFRMAADTGMRGVILALERSSDPSGLRIDERSMIVVETREEAVVMMERLVFKNNSERIFDPGEDGLLIPLPDGFKSAQEVQGGAPVEPKPDRGVVLKAIIPPNRAAEFAVSAQFGFVLPSDGEAEMEIKQPLPFGLESPFVVVPAASKLTLRGPGLRRVEDRADGQGNMVQRYELAAIEPGGTLALTVTGLPSRDRTGQTVAGVIAAIIVVAGVAGAGGGRKGAAGAAGARAPTGRTALIDRRESLFGELVELERDRRRAAGKADETSETRRRELVTKLEAIYRELAEA